MATRHLPPRLCQALMLAACLLAAPPAGAQAPSAPPLEEGMAPPAGPDTILWINDDGAPRPVLGISYEEFAEAWRKAHDPRKTSELPLYTIENVEIAGEQKNGFAELTVRIDITLNTDQPVETPLGFGRSILLDMPTGLNRDDLFGYSNEGETHRAFFRGGGERRIELKLLTPVAAAGQRNELSFTAPRAMLSQLELQLTGRATEVSATNGLVVETGSTPQGAVLKAKGVVGRVRVSWRNPEQAPLTFEPVLTATGELLSELDAGSARTRARLTIESYGGEFDRFQVRLPWGAQLVPPPADEAPPVSIRSIPGEDERLVLVLLPEKTSGPVSVDITTEQPIGFAEAVRRDGQAPSSLVDLGGFKVLGAVRQYGDMALIVDQDSKLRWGNLAGARRIAVDELPETLGSPEVTHALRYFRPGFQAPVEVLRQHTRVEATTTYRIEINADEALLEVATQYQISGPPVLDFHFDLGDWTDTTADRVEPSGLIDMARVSQSVDGFLEVPLLKPQSAPLTVKFRARKSLPTDGTEFSFSLPRPAPPGLDLIGRSELIVTADPSLSLEVSPETHQTLRPEPVPQDLTPDNDPSGVRTQYFQSDYALLSNERLKFVARLNRRPAVRKARVITRVGVSAQESVCRQEFDFTLLNEPASSISLAAPPELLDSEDLRFHLLADRLEDPLLAPNPPLTWRKSADAGSAIVDLPRPWLGPLSIAVDLPSQAGWDTKDQDWRLPVAQFCPTGCDSIDMFLDISGPEGLHLRPADESSVWSESVTPSGSESLTRFVSSQPNTNVLLAQRGSTAGPRNEVVIEKAWRQAWFRGNQVQHRMAWRIFSGKRQVEIDLPRGVSPSDIEARVAGQRIFLQRITERKVAALLPADAQPADWTIELRYIEPQGGPGFSTLNFTSPRLVGDSSMAVSYWEVILPRERLLLTRPPGFETAWDIAWQQGRFRRRQSMETRQLESFVGATNLGLAPAAGEQVYLYSSLQHPPGAWSPRSIDRNVTALGTSAFLAVLGLAIGYAPGIWRAAGVGAGATSLALAGVLYPGELALVAQSGMIGLAALLVGWLTMVMLRPPRSAPIEVEDDSTAIRLSTSSIEGPLESGADRVSTSVSTATVEPRQPAQ